MISGRIVLLLFPLMLFLLWLFLSSALGRQPSRFALNTLLSLLLLLYFAAVMGTGIFWIAVQELPAFDWHYLLGYILFFLVLAHVVLHWRNVAIFFRSRAPASLKEPHGLAFRSWIRIMGILLLISAGGTAVFLLGGRFLSEKVVVVLPGKGEGGEGQSPSSRQGSVEVEGKKVSLAEFYHRGCSYPARAALSGIAWKERPPVYKTYSGKPERELPEVKPDGGPSVIQAGESWRTARSRFAASTMTLEDLSLLLYHTQGINKVLNLPGRSFDLRTAPSAGALYPVDIYVLSNRVEGLTPGLYHYQVKRNSLLQLKEGLLFPLLEAAAGSPHLYQPAAATAIMTVTFGRTGFKYKERCYRYVNMDTGHGTFNLTLCAASLGYSSPVIARFDDGLVNDFLGINAEEESALLLVPLGRALEFDPGFSFPDPRFSLKPLESSGRDSVSFLSLIHGGSCFRKEEGWEIPPRHEAKGASSKTASDGTPLSRGRAISLPEPVQGEGLYPVIRKRRSIRNYSDAPMDQEELASLCAAAVGTGRCSDPFLASSAPLNLYVVVRDVKNLSPGVYLFDRSIRSLLLLKAGEFSTQCYRACLRQDFCGTADALFVKTVFWKDMAQPDGDRGYRYACIRAGMAGEGLYLQASALNMGACGVGAFYDEEVAELVNCDPAEEAVLYVTAVGK